MPPGKVARGGASDREAITRAIGFYSIAYVSADETLGRGVMDRHCREQRGFGAFYDAEVYPGYSQDQLFPQKRQYDSEEA